MSDEENQSLMDSMKAVLTLTRWGIGLVSLVGIAWVAILVSDHFLLQNVSKDVEAIRPRVETLWWHSPYAEKP